MGHTMQEQVDDRGEARMQIGVRTRKPAHQRTEVQILEEPSEAFRIEPRVGFAQTLRGVDEHHEHRFKPTTLVCVTTAGGQVGAGKAIAEIRDQIGLAHIVPVGRNRQQYRQA